MVKKEIKTVIATMILGGAVMIGFPSCDNPEVMNTLKELQESDSISKEKLEKLQKRVERLDSVLNMVLQQNKSRKTKSVEEEMQELLLKSLLLGK